MSGSRAGRTFDAAPGAWEPMRLREPSHSGGIPEAPHRHRATTLGRGRFHWPSSSPASTNSPRTSSGPPGHGVIVVFTSVGLMVIGSLHRMCASGWKVRMPWKGAKRRAPPPVGERTAVSSRPCAAAFRGRAPRPAFGRPARPMGTRPAQRARERPECGVRRDHGACVITPTPPLGTKDRRSRRKESDGAPTNREGQDWEDQQVRGQPCRLREAVVCGPDALPAERAGRGREPGDEEVVGGGEDTASGLGCAHELKIRNGHSRVVASAQVLRPHSQGAPGSRTPTPGSQGPGRCPSGRGTEKVPKGR